MTTLAQYERARVALAEATSVREILAINAEVEHVKLYARQIHDRILIADAYAFQLRIERRLGEVIAAGKAVGHFHEGRRKKNGTGEEPFQSATLAEVGVDKKLSARSQQRASISEEAFERMVERTRERVASDRAKFLEGVVDGGRSVLADRREPDDSLDYFPTPPWATRALFERVFPALGERAWSSIWEPACGEGHIAEVCREYCDVVHATDVFDYGYGELFDFLAKPGDHPDETTGIRWIITNPPFGENALPFFEEAFRHAGTGVAMFVRSQWAVEGVERYERLFRDNPPTLFAPFVERVNLCKGRWEPEGSTAMAYCWLVWRKNDRPHAPFWIPPRCRQELSHPEDIARFTAHPVIKKQHAPLPPHDPDTGEILPIDVEERLAKDGLDKSHAGLQTSSIAAE